MYILNINSYYFTNKIHYFFRKELEQKSVKLKYFIPLYNDAKLSFVDNEVDETIIYNKSDKVIFFSKIFKSIYAIRRKVDLKQISLIHAHTLISDGLIAYFLHRKYGIPYIITIRNTDINYFLPNRIFRYLGSKILNKAKGIICLSPSYSVKLKTIYPDLSRTIDVLPNGLDNFWFDNMAAKKSLGKGEVIKILFVGRIDKNKNIHVLLQFLKTFTDRKYILSIVGSNDLSLDFNLLNGELCNGNSIQYLGKINDQNDLLRIYNENDVFAMLSFKETFGVTFLEALSQGLPIIYTKNEGVDGFFINEPVGRATSPSDLQELKKNMEFIIENYQTLSVNALAEVMRFRWTDIMEQYLKVIKTK